MSVVLPRLDRSSALELLQRYRSWPVNEIAKALPDTDAITTYSPVGGQRIAQAQLAVLRRKLLSIAHEHGLPGPIAAPSEWEAKSARLIHTDLRMTPHEASHDEVWSFLTCCWLLDIAIWRFGAEASVERFVGHLNRNTFRRMWWRAEVLGPDVDLAQLGEDELVNIMERPTLFSDRRLARAIALEMIGRVNQGIAVERMRLMREATKRLLRLTPFVSFRALDDEHMRLVVSDAFDAAAAGLAGAKATMPHRSSDSIPRAAPEVQKLERMGIAAPTGHLPESLAEDAEVAEFDQVAHAALAIARRTGQVTNATLREVVPYITAEEARDVFRALMERGDLVRRGVKRGTHYVIPAEPPGQPGPSDARPNPAEPQDGAQASPPAEQTPQSPPPPHPNPMLPASPRQRVPEKALRRLLRRAR